MKITGFATREQLPVYTAGRVFTERDLEFYGFCEQGVFCACKLKGTKLIVPFTNLLYIHVEDDDEIPTDRKGGLDETSQGTVEEVSEAEMGNVQRKHGRRRKSQQVDSD